MQKKEEEIYKNKLKKRPSKSKILMSKRYFFVLIFQQMDELIENKWNRDEEKNVLLVEVKQPNQLNKTLHAVNIVMIFFLYSTVSK